MLFFREKKTGDFMKVLIVDGQGGKIGSLIIEKILVRFPDVKLYAVGTNISATLNMKKAGAAYCATGENPVVVNSRDADIIAGPVGIILADAILGEVTPKMAFAIGSSSAQKVLVPVNNCNVFIGGVKNGTMSDHIEYTANKIISLIEEKAYLK